MKKVAFIIPYFGKFNNYFQLFLNSCKENNEYDWIIFTDDKYEYQYPDNVKVHYMQFDELKNIVKEKFDGINIVLNRAYKLCDYKPMYGYLFEEYLQSYKYWGFCDTDVIFGNINNFIDLDNLENYDKIGFLGHFTLFKNNKENNRLFMKNGFYKKVLESNASFKFDEEFHNSINNIYLEENKKIFYDEYYANIYVKSSNFKNTFYDFKTNEYITDKNNKSFFVWDKGNLTKYIIHGNNNVERKDFMYIHLQKRKMKVLNTNYDTYKIIPNSFENLEKDFTNNNFNKIKTKNFNLHYFSIRSKNLKDKIKKRIEKLKN